MTDTLVTADRIVRRAYRRHRIHEQLMGSLTVLFAVAVFCYVIGLAVGLGWAIREIVR